MPPTISIIIVSYNSAAQIGTASGQDATAPVSANSLTAYLTTSGSGGNKTYTAQYAGTSSTAPETVGITNTAPVGLDVVVQNFNTSASNGTETINCTNSAGNPIPETFTTATQCLNYAVNTAGVTIGGTAVAGVTTSLLPGTTDGGMKEGAIVVLPSTPGISSTTNTIAGATAVNIPFTLTATTIPPGTCTCSNTTCSPANKITYKPGTCSN